MQGMIDGANRHWRRDEDEDEDEMLERSLALTFSVFQHHHPIAFIISRFSFMFHGFYALPPFFLPSIVALSD